MIEPEVSPPSVRRSLEAEELDRLDAQDLPETAQIAGIVGVFAFVPVMIVFVTVSTIIHVIGRVDEVVGTWLWTGLGFVYVALPAALIFRWMHQNEAYPMIAGRMLRGKLAKREAKLWLALYLLGLGIFILPTLR